MSSCAEQIAKRYGSVAREYRTFWGPPLRAFAKPLLNSLPLESGALVADLGAGTGIIADAVARRTKRAVVALDLTVPMLHEAKAATALRAGADLLRLPVADRAVDVALTTFVLQHIREPGRAIAEAARILRPGGVLGTATWGPDAAESQGAYQVIEGVFKRRRVPTDELAAMPTWHARVESPSKMRRYARAAGLTVERAWLARVVFEWEPSKMLGWVSSMGPYGRRLAALDTSRRNAVLHDIEHRFQKLTPGAFVWAPEVVFMVAAKR